MSVDHPPAKIEGPRRGRPSATGARVVLVRLRARDILWRVPLLVLAAAAVCWAAWGAGRLGPFFDEPASITAGYVLWRAGEGLPALGRPPLGPLLESLGLWVTWGAGVETWPGLPEGDLDRLTAHVLSGDIPVLHMLWWARVPGLLATFLTALLVHRGAHTLWGTHWSALLAAVLYLLAPTTLAAAARADGGALSALFLTGAAVTGWHWLRTQRLGRLALALALAGLLTDWALWILIPFAAAVLLGEGLERVVRQGRRETSRGLVFVRGRLADLGRRSRRLALRVLIGALLFWVLMVELTGNWALWADLWRSAVTFWGGRHREGLPLYFRGGFSPSTPLLYQPALFALGTPLWLIALWALGACEGARGRAHAGVDSGEPVVDRATRDGPPATAPGPRLRALLYLHAGVLWMIALGALLFPPRGPVLWVPLMPLIAIVAGGAVRGHEGARVPGRAGASARALPSVDRAARGERWATLRGLFALAVVAFALWSADRAAPHWHAVWNSLARLTGGPSAWFAGPALDGGPAALDLEDHLDRTDARDELLLVAWQGRWSPAALGLHCLFLPSHGLIHEPTFRFNWRRPPAGLYVIARSLLVGQDCLFPDTYRWFREHPPEVWFGGGTLGLWWVRPEGEGRGARGE